MLEDLAEDAVTFVSDTNDCDARELRTKLAEREQTRVECHIGGGLRIVDGLRGVVGAEVTSWTYIALRISLVFRLKYPLKRSKQAAEYQCGPNTCLAILA